MLTANVVVLQVRCLGAFAFRSDGPWMNGPPFKRGRELLQYFVSYPRAAVSRETLSGTFWPDLDGETAAHRVHLAVTGARSALRSLIGDIDGIRNIGSSYVWNDSIRIESDVEALLSVAGREATHEEMEHAASVHGGEYLAGEHADWMYPLRVRCANAFATILERLAESATAAGNHARALEYALRLVEADPANENATRLTMRSLAACGRRGAALGAYDALVRYLERHLAIKPSAQTVSLRNHIASGDDQNG